MSNQSKNRGEQYMYDRMYRDFYYEEPHVQREYERLLQRLRDAEAARRPIGQQHRQAERANEAGAISEKSYRDSEDAYIGANNAIAEAKRAVEAFLNRNGNYKIRS